MTGHNMFPTDDEDMPALLTVAEVACLKQCAALAGMLLDVVGPEQTGPQDWRELVFHIHAIQNAVLSQAAARAYPRHFRLLGGRIRADSPS
jgi:hypothetical protein